MLKKLTIYNVKKFYYIKMFFKMLKKLTIYNVKKFYYIKMFFF